MKKLFSVALLMSLMLFSCKKAEEDKVIFIESQPQDVPTEANIPKYVLGKYYDVDDSNSFIIVTNRNIVETTESINKETRASLVHDSIPNLNINDNAAVIKHFDSLGFVSRFVGDTLLYSYKSSDTLFQLNSQQSLKIFKDGLYLNTLKENGYYTITRIKRSDDCLLFQNIISNDSLLRYDFTEKLIQGTDSGSSKYKLTPDKKGFKKLLKDKMFLTNNCYCKTKNRH